jgi:CO/xanthine dehydrogenase Mo-binding subunit
MGAMLANALFDATGIRIRQLPLTPQKIKVSLPVLP